GPLAASHARVPSGPRPDLAYALLDRATLARFDGKAWRRVPAPEVESLIDLSVAPDGELFLVAAWRGIVKKGTRVFRKDGEGWTETPIPTGAWIDGISVRGAGEAWAAGSDGVYRWDGRAWSAVEGVPAGRYTRVLATGGTVFALGDIGARAVRIV